MGLYRDETGQVFQLDDAFAAARGYSPVDPVEEQSIHAEHAQQQENEGLVPTLHAGATGALSGATLGMSDVLLGQGLPDNEREALVRELDAHPIARTTGEVVGTIASTMEGMPRTPTGYLSSLASHGIEKNLAEGGIKGTAKALNIMGAEGAIQSAGSYIGHAALEDKDVTAEGVAGALGTGYAFGAGAGGAALGVSKGSIAARRLFSRVMEGRTAAKDAATAWTMAREEALQADKATAQTLQTRLDEIQNAKREAMRYRNEAKSMTQEESIRAMSSEPRPEPNSGTAVPNAGMEGPTPLDAGIDPARGGGQTSIFKRPEPPGPFDAEAAGAFDQSMPDTAGQLNDVASTIGPREGNTTKVFKRPEAPSEATDLEKQLAGTKEKIDAGAALKDVKGEKAPRNLKNEDGTLSQDVKSIKKMLEEDAARGKAGEIPRDRMSGEVPKPRMSTDEMMQGLRNIENDIAVKGPREPEYGPTSRQRFGNLRNQLGKKLLPETLGEIRHARTSDLLSPEIADEEKRIAEALDELKASREALDRANAHLDDASDAHKALTSDQLAALRNDNKTNAGTPRARAMEILDAAHEDALLNAHSADPAEAGTWLKRADDVEHLMLTLPDEKDIYWNLGDEVSVVSRYEKAIAQAAEVAGDGAHPAAKQIAEGLSQAESDAERKMFERTTRAVDDTHEFGPTYKTPKERVQYSRERQLEAQRNLDSISANERDTAADLSKAKDKAREGERTKKATLREEAKAAKGSGIAEKLGVWEILDLPGMPKVSDLPVVGPILGAWLKFRTLKAALGRKMGMVAATGDAKAAVLAARTRDRVARAVDRSLGLAEKGSRVMAKQAPRVGGIMAARIYDDGEPDAPKGSPLPVQTAVRIRELAAYVNTPNAIENDVRKQMRDVTDPDLIASAEKHRRAMMEYLLDNAPKGPEQGMMKTVNWLPSPAESMSFARRYDAVNDPAGTWEKFEQQEAMLSLESAEALRNVYPQLFAQAQQRVLERVVEVKASIPYRTRIQMSMFYQLPLDSALQGDNMKITQSVYDRKVPIPPPGAPQPPTPSVAGSTDLTAIYQTTADRNALRR
jgi:hypothetical protein